MILFAECYLILQIELDEGDTVGAREGAVIQIALEESDAAEIPAIEIDPYDRSWDGIVPLEQDPLTRLRSLMVRLGASIRVGNEILDLEPFGPTGGVDPM